MADWSNVKSFVHEQYNAQDLTDDLMQLTFNTDNLRTQVVFMEHTYNDQAGNWLKVSSPIGRTDQIDLLRAARSVSDNIVGGLIVIGELAYVTNSVPMANIDANEVVDPLQYITLAADTLEAELLGHDVL